MSSNTRLSIYDSTNDDLDELDIDDEEDKTATFPSLRGSATQKSLVKRPRSTSQSTVSGFRSPKSPRPNMQANDMSSPLRHSTRVSRPHSRLDSPLKPITTPQKTEVSPKSSPNLKTPRRRIPGPAGELSHNASGDDPTQEMGTGAFKKLSSWNSPLSGPGRPADLQENKELFKRGPWIAMLRNLNIPYKFDSDGELTMDLEQFSYNILYIHQKGYNRKIPCLVALVLKVEIKEKSVFATLIDPTAWIGATINFDAYEQHKDLREGAVVILRDVSVISWSMKSHTLLILSENVGKVYSSRIRLPPELQDLLEATSTPNKQVTTSPNDSSSSSHQGTNGVALRIGLGGQPSNNVRSAGKERKSDHRRSTATTTSMELPRTKNTPPPRPRRHNITKSETPPQQHIHNQRSPAVKTPTTGHKRNRDSHNPSHVRKLNLSPISPPQPKLRPNFQSHAQSQHRQVQSKSQKSDRSTLSPQLRSPSSSSRSVPSSRPHRPALPLSLSPVSVDRTKRGKGRVNVTKDHPKEKPDPLQNRSNSGQKGEDVEVALVVDESKHSGSRPNHLVGSDDGVVYFSNTFSQNFPQHDSTPETKPPDSKSGSNTNHHTKHSPQPQTSDLSQHSRPNETQSKKLKLDSQSARPLTLPPTEVVSNLGKKVDVSELLSGLDDSDLFDDSEEFSQRHPQERAYENLSQTSNTKQKECANPTCSQQNESKRRGYFICECSQH